MKICTGKHAEFQGDLCIIPIARIPDGLDEAQPDGAGNHVVAHSETGHHHVVSSLAARVWVASAMLAYMRVREQAELLHMRPFDQHEALSLPPGDYQILRQREGAPAGWRRVED